MVDDRRDAEETGGEGIVARLQQEARSLAGAPILTAVAAVLGLLIIWGALHWSYSAALSNRDGRIAFLDRRVNDYRGQLGTGSPEEIRKRIEALEQENRSLRVRLQPRRLAPPQRQSIIDRSRLPSGAQPLPITVAYEADCSDCERFAEDFLDALGERGNWQVTPTVIEAPADRPRGGLAIRVEQPLRPPPGGVRLQQVLRSAGLAFDMVPGGTGGSVELLVTERVAP